MVTWRAGSTGRLSNGNLRLGVSSRTRRGLMTISLRWRLQLFWWCHEPRHGSKEWVAHAGQRKWFQTMYWRLAENCRGCGASSWGVFETPALMHLWRLDPWVKHLRWCTCGVWTHESNTCINAPVASGSMSQTPALMHLWRLNPWVKHVP